MQEIHPAVLWIGNARDARNPQGLYDAGIAAVVELAYEEPVAQLPRDLIYCRFPLNDGGGNDPELLSMAVDTVVGLLRRSTPTLIACTAGMSRSPTIAAVALAVYLNQRPHDVVRRIGQARSLEISGPLWQDVLKAVAIKPR